MALYSNADTVYFLTYFDVTPDNYGIPLCK